MIGEIGIDRGTYGHFQHIPYSFSRVVTPWQHHHHLHPFKQAVYAHFQGWLLLGNTTSTSTLESKHTCLFSRAVAPWQHHLHLHPWKQAYVLAFESICSLATSPPSPPLKMSIRGSFLRAVTPWQHHLAAYARFWLLGSSLPQPTITTTLHPRKRVRMLVFWWYFYFYLIYIIFIVHNNIRVTHKGVSECGKCTNTRYFFFRQVW